MATTSANTSIALPAGALLMFKVGGTGRAIDGAGNVYILGLNDIQVGPAPKAQTVQVLVTSGTLTYVVENDGSPDNNLVYDPFDDVFRTPDGVQRGAGGGGGVVAVSSSRALTSADNGKVLRCSTAVTLEYPEGLGESFSCIVEPPSSGTVTLDPTGSCTLNGGTANLTRTRSNNPAGFVIRALSANVAGVSGS